MDIGQIIKKLRLERGFTQEGLAEQLNVSAKAVSKWENGGGLPDISLVVPLSRVFGVSTDALFGTAGSNDDEEVQRLIDETMSEILAREMRSGSDLTAFDFAEQADTINGDQYDILHGALPNYPNNIKLLHACVDAGVNLGFAYSDEIVAEIERMSRLIFEYGKDIGVIMSTHRLLVHFYTRRGYFDKAREHAMTYTEYPTSRGMLLAVILASEGKREESAKQSSQNIISLLAQMSIEFSSVANFYSSLGQPENDIAVRRAYLDIADIIYGGEQHSIQSYWFTAIANDYLRLGDKEAALDWLEKLVDYSIADKERIGKLNRYNSLILRGAEHDLTGIAYNGKAEVQRTLATFPQVVEHLRDHPRYVALMARVDAMED
ncbi:MAG: XRE family transcriptional regulator [Oscillospiraceae bacterium]|jgi:transcriptional regulator with XRE-family HTH domain|nr:XRE family transcriptional regulator [Oscillospiraceae bacterium]